MRHLHDVSWLGVPAEAVRQVETCGTLSVDSVSISVVFSVDGFAWMRSNHEEAVF